MGRKKTKKNKGGRGGGRHHSGSSTSAPAQPPAQAPVVEAELPPVPVPREKPTAAVNEEASLGATPDQAKVGGACGGDPPPSSSGTITFLKGGKPGGRIELCGLEAELAAVQDLQAAMAATLSNVDSNLAKIQRDVKSNDGTQKAVITEVNVTDMEHVGEEPARLSDDEEKGQSEESNMGKAGKQTTKETKQEENLREAQLVRELASSSEDKCEKKEQQSEVKTMGEKVFGAALERMWFRKEEEAKGRPNQNEDPSGKDEDTHGDKETEAKKESLDIESNSHLTKDDGMIEDFAEVEVNSHSESLHAEEQAAETFTDIQGENKTPDEVKNNEEEEVDMSVKEVDSEKTAPCCSGIDLQTSVLHVTPALAQYLIEECKKMQDLQKAAEAEEFLPKVVPTSFENPAEEDEFKEPKEMEMGKDKNEEETPSRKAGQYMSYADAVKASLQAAWERECEQQKWQEEGESAETSFVESLSETSFVESLSDQGRVPDGGRFQPGMEMSKNMASLGNTEAGHVYKYLVSEYEPCIRRLDAEEAEVRYQEKLAALLDSAHKSMPPRIEISLASDVKDSDDEDVELTLKKMVKVDISGGNSAGQDTVDKSAVAMYASMVEDVQKMNAKRVAEDAEYRYQAIIAQKTSPSISADHQDEVAATQPEIKATSLGSDEIEIAKYLAHECSKMEFVKGALRAEAAHQVKLTQLSEEVSDDHSTGGGPAGGFDPEEARHAEARRLTDVLEAANMEVVSVIDSAEKEFLLQHDQQRSRPWRWVRADTAPGYISVPETVHEPVSDTEAEVEPDNRSVGVTTDMAGFVFQCKDDSVQTETEYSECCKCGQMALPFEKQFAERLREETAQKLALENLVRLLESEAAEQRQHMTQLRMTVDKLENNITDQKAEVTEAKRLTSEYKTRCEDLERSLESSRSMVNSLEGQFESASFYKGGIDYMLEAKLAMARAVEAQAKVEDLQTELLFSKTEVQRLLDRLAEHNRQQTEMVPISVHEQLMTQADSRGNDLHLRVMQLEAELAKLKCVKDVWGSVHQGDPPMQGGLGMGFQPLGSTTGVYDLPPSLLAKPTTTGVDLPSCLSGLGLEDPDTGVSNLTARLLSNLQAKVDLNPGFVVAPLALQEDIDSDDDAAWSSASEQPKGNTPPPIPDRSSPSESTVLPSKPALPAKPALPPKPSHLMSEKPALPPKPDTLQDQRPLTPGHEQPTSFDENTSSPKLKSAKKPKGPRERQRPKKFQK